MVSTDHKKEFIRWFLHSYSFLKKEIAWLLTYLISDEKLLEKIHFVENIHHLPKAIFVSTDCVTATPFKFYKNNRVTPDVETAFLDIRSNPEEELFIALMFKDRDSSLEYAAVLEVNPMEKQNVVNDTLLELLAELILDHSVREFNKKQLYKGIDEALKNGNKEKFIELTNHLNELLQTEQR